MAYGSDQFFGINNTGENITGSVTSKGNWNIAGASNPPFRYPDRTVRTEYNGKPTSQVLKRGYIRSLRTSVDGIKIPILKCQFQFNPYILSQAVQMNNSMYDVFHQPPEQFSQPFVGATNFGFELTFDRRWEMNAPNYGGYDPLTSTATKPYNELNTWEKSDPSEIGVLRDIGTLFAIIGQGASEAQLQYQQAVLQRSINLEATARGDLAETDVAQAISRGSEFLDTNIGNTAFLLPNPVRILFSSLFMVEGLVQQTAVDYVLFSTNMVPMVAKVQLQVEAKYIGFAKERTFLTVQLAQEVSDYRRQKNEAQERAAATTAALNAGAGRVEMMFGTNPTPLPTVGYYPVDTGPVDLNNVLLNAQSAYVLWQRVPGVKDNASNAVTKLFEGGDSISIGVQAKMQVYGPFTESTIGGGDRSQDTLRQFTTGTPILSSSYSWPTVASTKDAWVQFASGSMGKINRTSQALSGLSDKYFVVRYEANCTAVADGVISNGRGEKVVLFGPGAPTFDNVRNFNQVIPVFWNTPAVVGDVTIQDSTVVINDDNRATEPRSVGSVSKVGVEPPKSRFLSVS
jgi:hypothetical protein